MCKNSSQKLAALSRLVNYIESEERKLIFNSMFCSRTSNNLNNRTHKRNLRVILNDYEKDLSLFGTYAKFPEKLKFLNIFPIFFFVRIE